MRRIARTNPARGVGIADRAAQTALEGLRTDQSDVESDEKYAQRQTERGFHVASRY
jgi:hypothetical protein